jgi:hypothetical protein
MSDDGCTYPDCGNCSACADLAAQLGVVADRAAFAEYLANYDFESFND